MSTGLGWRARRRWALVVLLVGLPLYIMAAVSLATHLYYLDHDGRWPPSLDALVPAYLPAVPMDPFSPTHEPLQYLLARNGSRPVVFSVGEDMRNDTPDESVIPTGPLYDETLPTPSDIWRDLSRFDEELGAATNGVALMDEQAGGDCPAIVDRSEQVVGREPDVGEELLAEPGVPGHEP